MYQLTRETQDFFYMYPTQKTDTIVTLNIKTYVPTQQILTGTNKTQTHSYN